MSEIGTIVKECEVLQCVTYGVVETGAFMGEACDDGEFGCGCVLAGVAASF